MKMEKTKNKKISESTIIKKVNISVPKIIYISFIRLTNKVARDWYIDFCKSKGAEVEYWDIVSLVREEHNEYGMLNPDYLKYIKTYDELEKLIRLQKNDRTIYVMIITYIGKYTKPYRILTKYDCKMVMLSWGAMPAGSPLTTPKLIRRINNFIKGPIKYIFMVTNILKGVAYRRLKLVKQYEIIFAAGNQLTLSAEHVKKIVSINLMDYEHYVKSLENASLVPQGRYAVFIDANAPYHSDNGITGLKELDANEYFESINNFFSLIEEKFQLRVVIAANPKSNYGSEVYKNREFYRMQTADLVKGAEFVILHQSTALSYAVLNNKPLIFIYTEQMAVLLGNSVIAEIENLAKYLDANIYNINKIYNKQEILLKLTSEDRYNEYKYNYITSTASENKSTSEIFWNEICKIFK
jgi:hypothetical protein